MQLLWIPWEPTKLNQPPLQLSFFIDSSLPSVFLNINRGPVLLILPPHVLCHWLIVSLSSPWNGHLHSCLRCCSHTVHLALSSGFSGNTEETLVLLHPNLLVLLHLGDKAEVCKADPKPRGTASLSPGHGSWSLRPAFPNPH